jgi:hypothetical protein
VVRSQELGFAVMFDKPIERRVCPDDRFPEFGLERDHSGDDPQK